MLILLTPSKTMDVTSPLPFAIEPTKPPFSRQSMEVYAAVAVLRPHELQQAMKMSTDLAEKTWQQYHAHEYITKPALWSYVGDVYRGVQSASMTKSDGDWAQRHLVIASALYGLLRPYDAIFPYRLEMQAKLRVGESNDLCEFWGRYLANYVQDREQDTLVVLSSEEYAKAVTKNITSLRIITPKFLDTKPNGTVGQVPIYNKQMRGVMARWMIDHRVEDVALLRDFSAHSYVYDEARSTLDAPAFTRAVMRPLDLPSKVGLQNRQ